MSLLAAQAAVAIENARLYESANRWLAQLESLAEVGNALAGETELAPLLELIATRLGELIDAELVVITLPTSEGDLRVEAAAGPQSADLVGTLLKRPGSKSARVLERQPPGSGRCSQQRTARSAERGRSQSSVRRLRAQACLSEGAPQGRRTRSSLR